MPEEKRLGPQISKVDRLSSVRLISIPDVARQGGTAFWCAMTPFARPSGRMELSRNASRLEKAIAMKAENSARTTIQLAMLAAINEAKRHWTQSWPLTRAFWMGATIYRRNAVEQKPDLDNYLKFIADAGTKLMWQDDAQLVGYLLGTRKIQAERQGVSVLILPDLAVHRLLLEPAQMSLSIEGRETQGARA